MVQLSMMANCRQAHDDSNAHGKDYSYRTFLVIMNTKTHENSLLLDLKLQHLLTPSLSSTSVMYGDH